MNLSKACMNLFLILALTVGKIAIAKSIEFTPVQAMLAVSFFAGATFSGLSRYFLNQAAEQNPDFEGQNQELDEFATTLFAICINSVYGASFSVGVGTGIAIGILIIRR